MTNRVAKNFDAMYKEGYDSGLSGLTRLLLQRFSKPRPAVMLEHLPSSEDLLDLGCGTGEFCRLAAPRCGLVTGVDFSAEAVAKAREDAPENLRFEVADLNQALAFSDASFSTVSALVVLDYVYNLNGLLAEVRRVLRPGGRFLIEVNNLGFLPRRLRLALGRYPKISSVADSEWARLGWDASACHLFTLGELRRFLAQFGFTVERVSGSGIFAPLRRWWPALLCGDLILICRKSRNG